MPGRAKLYAKGAAAMPVILLRTLLVYLTTIGAMRLMGKRQLGELQPSELVTTILISNLASISIEAPELPLTASLVPVLLIAALELLFSALSFRVGSIARLLAGKPMIIIRDGQVDQDTLRETRITMNDLLEALRGKDIFDLSEVAYAVVETNGSLSVCKAWQHEMATRKDLSLPRPAAQKPKLPLVIDGQIAAENLAFCGKSEEWVTKILRQKKIPLARTLLLLGDDTEEYQLIEK